MQTNKSILSYSLKPVLTQRGTTALTGIINGMRAFVPSFETVADFEQAVKEDNLVVSGITEGGAERKNAKGETFISRGSITWVRKAAQPTATEQLIMNALIEKALTRERTKSVDAVTVTTEAVKTNLAKRQEIAAQKELERQKELELAGSAEPVLS